MRQLPVAAVPHFLQTSIYFGQGDYSCHYLSPCEILKIESYGIIIKKQWFNKTNQRHSISES